jgi:Domain of unknown function (DUF4190)
VANLGRWIFERDGNAVAAPLFALAGIIGFGIILGPIAIGLGLLARRNIASTGRPGIRLAWAGIFIGLVAFILPWFYVL